ncbi:MAG: carbon storage regulator [Gemmataceae bacterium]
MLVLSRKPGEAIRVGDDVTIRVLAVQGRQVRLGIEAPASHDIVREELLLTFPPQEARPTLSLRNIS